MAASGSSPPHPIVQMALSSVARFPGGSMSFWGERPIRLPAPQPVGHLFGSGTQPDAHSRPAATPRPQPDPNTAAFAGKERDILFLTTHHSVARGREVGKRLTHTDLTY